MRTGEALVNTVVTESPVALIACIAAPEAAVCPCIASGTKHTALKASLRIVGCCTVNTNRSMAWSEVPVGCECMHWRERHAIGSRAWVLRSPLRSSLLPLALGRVAKSKPVLTAFASPVTPLTKVPVAVAAGATVVVHCVLNPLASTFRAVNIRFRVYRAALATVPRSFLLLLVWCLRCESGKLVCFGYDGRHCQLCSDHG